MLQIIQNQFENCHNNGDEKNKKHIILSHYYHWHLDISRLVFRHFFEVSCSVGLLQAALLLLLLLALGYTVLFLISM